MKFTMVDGCSSNYSTDFCFQEIYIRMVRLGIRTLKVVNIFVFKAYIVCTLIYLIGTESVGSTLGAPDEVKVDPPLVHPQSSSSSNTICCL